MLGKTFTAGQALGVNGTDGDGGAVSTIWDVGTEEEDDDEWTWLTQEQLNGLWDRDAGRIKKELGNMLTSDASYEVDRAVLKTTPDMNADAWNTKLYTPPGVVSAQEHDQIEQKLDGWANDLATSFHVLPKLQYPLHPIWITPSTTVFPRFPDTDAERRFYPVICISASKQVSDGTERRVTGFAYIQGSGDDHELWSMGLTPAQFWKHKTTLLHANRNELPTLVQTLTSSTNALDAHTNSNASFHPTPIHHVHGRLSICTTHDIRSSVDAEFAVVYLTSADQAPPAFKDSPCVLCIQTPKAKKASITSYTPSSHKPSPSSYSTSKTHAAYA